MATIKLIEVAHSRTGDKGNTLNFSLIPYREEDFDLLKAEATVERFTEHLRHIVKGSITRYELPTIKALNFVCEQALLGGVTTSIALDTHGKSISSAVLEMEIERH
ncbi:hypothetical protein FZC83_17005 [Rossellomorea marisflavi]|jgi:hypothetical protein|uniref:AtuA-like ferredoxin-fold domain-containing protein n=1 Tax=Rossellomorea marisflavi TaxID=189381 RepID=A0A5D4RRT3_9BACI|nr:hypothetical protein [Rossellomorea marisflavi]TYS52528.1 hypothetical protein FZC83_17005 [Rossellomorea marisflavi]WJV19390.1 hypothetical protein QU593_02470 [Rossellomorea marisflavi]